MKELPDFGMTELIDTLSELLRIPSPTGSADQAIDFVRARLEAAGLYASPTRKGGITATLEGESSDSPRALTAHLDTLGAMVREVKDNGRLKLTQVGHYAWNTIEGEGCTVMTSAPAATYWARASRGSRTIRCTSLSSRVRRPLT